MVLINSVVALAILAVILSAIYLFILVRPQRRQSQIRHCCAIMRTEGFITARMRPKTRLRHLRQPAAQDTVLSLTFNFRATAR